jgi:uncharacterized membrane protein (UPF0127 family)
MSHQRLAVLVAIAGLALADPGDAATGRVADQAAINLAQREICIRSGASTARLWVEVAQTEADRDRGLMERRELPEEAGMLFIFDGPQPPKGAFWMYRTRIPLDIAFLGPAGEVRSIRSMLPCVSDRPERCTRYAAGAPFSAALEVHAGFFASRRIAPGDRVIPAGADGCPTQE